MGTHIRSVMSKTLLIVLVAAIVWHESLGSNDLESLLDDYPVIYREDRSIKEANKCEAYKKEHAYTDSKDMFDAKYEFQITHEKGNFDFARQQCVNMGGDLITTNLGPEGEQYHKQIRDLLRHRNVKAWIGISDRAKEGIWRFQTNMQRFDHTHHGNVFEWYRGEPNNAGNQDCAYVGYQHWSSLDDGRCDYNFYGLCEIKIVDCDA